MARPREFKYDAALKGAMDVFWRQGYRATNLPDLLNAMGLTRGSFYKAFGDKETAYLKALDYYGQQIVTPVVSMLEGCEKENAVACLAQLFRPGVRDNRGCFICNAMVEMGGDHPVAAAKANAMAARMRNAIHDVLIRYQTFERDADTAETADLVLHLYFGMQAMGKAGGSTGDWTARLQTLIEPARLGAA